MIYISFQLIWQWFYSMPRFWLLVNNNDPEGDYDAKRLQFRKEKKRNDEAMERSWDLTTIHFAIKTERLDNDREWKSGRGDLMQATGLLSRQLMVLTAVLSCVSHIGFNFILLHVVLWLTLWLKTSTDRRTERKTKDGWGRGWGAVLELGWCPLILCTSWSHYLSVKTTNFPISAGWMWYFFTLLHCK